MAVPGKTIADVFSADVTTSDGATSRLKGIRLSAEEAALLGEYASWLSRERLMPKLFCRECGPDCEVEVNIDPTVIGIICDHQMLFYEGPVPVVETLHPEQGEVLVSPQRVVIHHHGTLFRKMSDWFNLADPTLARLRLISNFELRRYGDGLRWLPNPIPVAEYRALRSLYFQPSPCVRIGHSPSKRELKGTETFLAAVETMRRVGLAVEPVLIENQPHGEALRLKASCDLFFDSFDLGLQCSGLEAGAMGIPVLAGDEYVRAEYEREVGSVPYVFVTPETLADAMIDLAQHEEERQGAAERLASYVTEYHDEAAVALRYLDLLDEAFRWRGVSLAAGTARGHPAAVDGGAAPCCLRRRSVWCMSGSSLRGGTSNARGTAGGNARRSAGRRSAGVRPGCRRG
ncbi:MAG: hypothetical protein UY40_C0020G0017 [candidate division CPR1 bacterium GW2011_GWC1_49_13]|uniref:Uncharacterized protein n=1 Tax=candidate division CPR1 bacterium GW2011_GWC1_49_13 TaxID=1618342 RepID=A0A0G1VGL9_9BACT|nr:MAG: hypothetical protein UY40_C0020G0017 [candidate division CPR1 bacterium GW2011_GWC1_49_13]